MPESRIPSGYTDVDAAMDPAVYIRRLDEVAVQPLWRTIKERTYALLDLQPGNHILDIGCGTGDDVRALAQCVGPQGRAIGVDISSTMVAEALIRSRRTALSTHYLQGDVYRLDLPDDSFDGCRAERVFQHLVDPHRALLEMVRVARPGGRVVIVEPDYGTENIQGANAVITRKILKARCDHFECGTIGRQLPNLYKNASLEAVRLTLFNQEQTTNTVDSERHLLRKYVTGAREVDAISESEGAAWLRDLDEAGKSGRYRRAIKIFLVAGCKAVR
ncbi:MAG: hypothetical protein NVSMB52_17730 [Chloroflexota bacterium]